MRPSLLLLLCFFLVPFLASAAAAETQPPVPLDVAANIVTDTVAESVALLLEATPADERALVLTGTRLDAATLDAIRRSATAATRLVDAVAAQHALGDESRHYLVGALVGLGLIRDDYPAAAGRGPDATALRLILAFRHGVRAGIEEHRAVRRARATAGPAPAPDPRRAAPPSASNTSVLP